MFNKEEIENEVQNMIEIWKKDRIELKGYSSSLGSFNEWEKEVFYFPLEPRKPISGFDRSSSFFLSKKIPMRVVANLSQDSCHNQDQID
jgi:hypothetical protein